MSEELIIFCGDTDERSSAIFDDLSTNSKRIVVCQHKQLELTVSQYPEANLVFVGKQPDAALREVVELAQFRQMPLLILIFRFKVNHINGLCESSGHVMIPYSDQIDLLAWVQYAQKVRTIQVKASREFEKLNDKLEDRKHIEKAKGLLMRIHQLDEESAFKALRNSAMKNSQPMGQVAKNIITTLEMME